ncbi:tyrosine-protein phosphatase [Oceanicoccus sp. KOV_DT_Chl]|uniref:tyrosine-protein phosphatase n=1 Tax=Oceanicoccus sp. KOV_DT_Chl TaxID=1904639 RepID=UPI000C7D2209|nr:tyrosine-protein phosphatase [Oceanicoccus sp. KOV_DT_Chl]
MSDSDNMTMLPSRHLPFEGTPNFRDYGGYQTIDGRTIKWRTLFRSGQLSALTSNDHQQFTALDIRVVFDFRRDAEREHDPSCFPVNAMPEVVGLPIDPGSSTGFFDKVGSGSLGDKEMADYMCLINREFALEQGAIYRQMFQYLLSQQAGGSLVHCAAGKDRTGFAAAMVLSALGVSRATIMQDYMLTADYFNIENEIERIKNKYQWQGDGGAIRPMLEVRESYLQTAFDAIDNEFPSLDIYLQEVLGVGVEEKAWLQERYLI